MAKALRRGDKVSTTIETTATRNKVGAPGTVAMTTMAGGIPGIMRPRGGTTRENGSRGRAAIAMKAATTEVTTDGEETILIYLFVACVYRACFFVCVLLPILLLPKVFHPGTN